MTEKELFNHLEAITKSANECEIIEDNVKYTIRIMLGKHSCDYTISTKIKPVKNAKDTITIINNSNTMNRFSLNKNVLSLTTRAWIDKKPSLQGMEELICISMAELICVKNILEMGVKNGKN